MEHTESCNIFSNQCFEKLKGSSERHNQNKRSTSQITMGQVCLHRYVICIKQGAQISIAYSHQTYNLALHRVGKCLTWHLRQVPSNSSETTQNSSKNQHGQETVYKLISDIGNSNTCKGNDIANSHRQAHKAVLISLQKYIEPVTISCNCTPCKEENRARNN